MSKTKAFVKEHAADILGIKTVGQALQAPASEALDKYWDAAYDEIKADNINIFSSSGPIPDKLFHHFAMIIADKGKEAYKVPDKIYQRIQLGEAKAQREFKKFANDTYQSIDKVTDY